ncbi:MAG TPA: hypothetical protein VFU05_11055 [Cyclobacteriaceae bacterium]|nr:hypothetical protein [Cyclobacteriaceae bacterium]
MRGNKVLKIIALVMTGVTLVLLTKVFNIYTPSVDTVKLKLQVLQKNRVVTKMDRQLFETGIARDSASSNPIIIKAFKEARRVYEFQDSANCLLQRMINSSFSKDTAQIYLSRFCLYVEAFDATQPSKLRVAKDFIFYNRLITFPDPKIPGNAFANLDPEVVKVLAMILAADLDEYVEHIRTHYVS